MNHRQFRRLVKFTKGLENFCMYVNGNLAEFWLTSDDEWAVHDGFLIYPESSLYYFEVAVEGVKINQYQDGRGEVELNHGVKETIAQKISRKVLGEQ